MSSELNQGRRRATIIGLTFMGLAFLSLGATLLLGGCTVKPAGTNDAPAGATAAPAAQGLQAENEQLRSRVAELEKEAQRLGSKVVAQQELLAPLSINCISYSYKRRLVTRDRAKLLAMPREGTPVLTEAQSGAVLEVLDAASANDTGLWLYVAAPVYSSPTNCKGWIRESDTVPLTRENRNQIRGDLYLKAGTPVYEWLEDFAAIAKTKPRPLAEDARGWLDRRQDGYADLALPGGLSVLVEEKYLIYPPLD
ncbi:MAG: hypothetical protein ACYC5Y_09020 [Symbiobacteriia bacterium]